MIKKLKLMSLFILLTVVYQIGVIKVDALTIDSLKYRINSDGEAYDVYGIINSGTEFDTTYANDGYYTFLKVDNNEVEFVDKINTDVNINGIKVNISLSKGNDNKTVIVKYLLTNVSNESKTFKLASTADNELADNDYAAIYKDGHSKVIVTQDYNPTNCETDDDECTAYIDSYGTQLTIAFSPEVSTSWIGNLNTDEIMENLFTDGKILSYTLDDQADTIFAYSWAGSLAAGESKTYTTTFNAKVAEKSTVKFYKYGETEPITKEALLGGSVKTETVHEEDNYVYEWNTKKDGTGNYYPANRSMLVSEKDMKLYELKYDKNHNIILNSNNNVTITTENGNAVEHHGTIKYNLTPKEGYKIVSVIVNDNEKVNELKDNILTLTDVMGDVNINVKAVPDYKLTEGANQNYVVNKDNQLKFKVNAGYDLFARGGKVYIDNVLLDTENYSTKDSDGNALFVLNKKYLDSLASGTHEIKFVFADEGEAITNFTIEKDSNSINNPKTSDNIVFYISTGIISIICLIGTSIHTYKRKQVN